MEIKAARRIGGGISIQTLLFVVGLLELFWLVEETRGDFANGILFFLQEKSFVWVGLKYSFLTLGIFSGYLLSIYAANNAPQNAWKSLPSVLIRFTVLLVASGIWSGWRIKRR
jgi:hypothetical protein